MAVGSGDYPHERQSVSSVGEQMHLVAEKPFFATLLRVRAVLDRPVRLKVAHDLTIGVRVGSYRGGVDRHFLADVRQFFPQRVQLSVRVDVAELRDRINVCLNLARKRFELAHFEVYGTVNAK